MSQFTKVTNGNAFLGIDDGSLKGLISISEKVMTEAKTLAPVDLGQLENSLMYKISNGDSGGFNTAVKPKAVEKATAEIRDPRKKTNKLTSYVGFNLLYGVYQEFGTKKLKPQPFLRPALDIVVNKTDPLKVLAKIQADQLLGALKKGQKRETFNV